MCEVIVQIEETAPKRIKARVTVRPGDGATYGERRAMYGLSASLGRTLRVAAQASSFRSPAEGVQSQELRNGEAEAVANAVGRESVAQGRTRSNTANNPRRGPRRKSRRESGTPTRRWLDANGPTISAHKPDDRQPGAVTRKPGNF